MNNQRQARQSKIAAVQSRHHTSERKRKLLIYGTVSLVLLALVGSVAFVIVGEAQRQRAVDAAAGRPIQAVQTFDDLSRTHTEDEVDYQQSPGVGGDHAPVWTNCGAYASPVDEQRAVHSLEHGAVWLTYNPQLADEQVAELADLASSRNFVLVSPNPEQDSPLVATAWGKQVELDGTADKRMEPFLTKYVQGPQTPEPGAACFGGVNG